MRGMILDNGILKIGSTTGVTPLGASQDDLVVGDTTLLRVNNTSGANINITGIGGGETSRVLYVVNESAFTVTLKHEDAASAVTNRFQLPGDADLVLSQHDLVILFYAGSGRWTHNHITVNPFTYNEDGENIVVQTNNTVVLEDALSVPYDASAIGDGKYLVEVSGTWDHDHASSQIRIVAFLDANSGTDHHIFDPNDLQETRMQPANSGADQRPTFNGSRTITLTGATNLQGNMKVQFRSSSAGRTSSINNVTMRISKWG